MKVKCIHGYFIFSESRSGEISDFMSYSGLTLVPKDDFFTFETIQDAPTYSLIGKTFLNYPAIATFDGKPWDVFEKNLVVYDFNSDLMRPIAAITQRASLGKGPNYYFSNGLVLPGSFLSPGQKIKNYSAWFSFDRLQWRYSEVTIV